MSKERNETENHSVMSLLRIGSCRSIYSILKRLKSLKQLGEALLECGHSDSVDEIEGQILSVTGFAWGRCYLKEVSCGHCELIIVSRKGVGACLLWKNCILKLFTCLESHPGDSYNSCWEQGYGVVDHKDL